MNTHQDKQRFFAAYWGQEVAVIGDGTPVYLNYPEATDYLELHSLHTITDEDAIEVARLLYPTVIDWETPIRQYGYVRIEALGDFERYVCFNDGLFDAQEAPILASENMLVLRAIDYLRYRGYLLPFGNYTIDQIKSLGWAREAER